MRRHFFVCFSRAFFLIGALVITSVFDGLFSGSWAMKLTSVSPALPNLEQGSASISADKSSTSSHFNLPSDSSWLTLAVTANSLWLGNDLGEVVRLNHQGEVQEKSQLKAGYQVRSLIAENDHQSYALLIHPERPSLLYQTRNGGYSWRLLHQTQELLGCMALQPNGEAWILGASQNNHWYTVRSNNGRHWNSNRSGFEKPPLEKEGVSFQSDHCGRFKNNTWGFVTQGAEHSRLIYKTGRAFRFQVESIILEPTAQTTTDSFQAETVWPLAEEQFLIAGGHPEAQLILFENNQFTPIQTPSLAEPFTLLYQAKEQLWIGNEAALYQADLQKALNNQDAWQKVTAKGAKSISCYQAHCWYLSNEGQVHRLHSGGDPS